jgi:hypothetical protein
VAAPAARWLPRAASGEAALTVPPLSLRHDPSPLRPSPPEPSPLRAAPADGGYAADPDLAGTVLRVDGDTLAEAPSQGPLLCSLDPARLLGRPGDGTPLATGPQVAAAAAEAAGVGALATAALALGTGRRLLAGTVEYVGTRVQFGTPIGGFQAVKHRLADVLLQLEFAEPLLHAAAVALEDGRPGATADVAAAKAACGEAGYAAARAALQLHGAIGYTDEFDLSLWIRRARVLRTAWGGPAECRRAVLAARAGVLTGRT